MTAPVASRSRRLQVGRFTCHAIHAGLQRLDGGAMFGVVPKTLWEKRIPADARNRIPLAMRCLLVEHDVGLVLVDTGAGNKESEKFHDIYGLENGAEDGRTALEAGIRAAGHRPEDVRFVISTHLHFDHAGGNTFRDADGAVKPSFPSATYVVQAGELAYATRTNERTAASYFTANWEAIREAGKLETVEGAREFLPGIHLRPTPGHTPFHQSVIVDGGGERLCFLGDVVPTSAHLPLPWIMGYDVEPLVTLESKRTLLSEAAAEGWTVMFEHDAHVAWSHVMFDGRAYAAANPVAEG